jgi:hypothetical protein
VRYISANGTIEFHEAWAVRPSTEPLRVRDVRIADPLLGPGPGGGTGEDTVIEISNVEGLEDELNVRPKRGLTYVLNRAAMIGEEGDIEGVAGSEDDCVHVNGTSGPCGGGTISQFLSGSFIDGDLPGGAVDGSNRDFTLSQATNPVGACCSTATAFFRNGCSTTLSPETPSLSFPWPLRNPATS